MSDEHHDELLELAQEANRKLNEAALVVLEKINPLFGMRIPEGSNNAWEALTIEQRKMLIYAAENEGIYLSGARDMPEKYKACEALRDAGYLFDGEANYVYLTWQGFRIIPISEIEG